MPRRIDATKSLAFALSVTLASGGVSRGLTADALNLGLDARFRQFDENGDGKLTREAFPAAKLSDSADADKDGDGILTLVEFPLGAFKQVDKNGDGMVTPEEVKAYYGARRGQGIKQ